MSTVATVATKETVIEEIGDFFESLFDPQAKLYNELSEAEKQAATYGSGLIAIVNANLNGSPAVVQAEIQRLFPSLDLSVVQGFFDELQKAVDPSNTSNPLTLADAITWAQGYLKLHAGGIWEIISSTAASIITTLLSPETPIEKIVDRHPRTRVDVVGHARGGRSVELNSRDVDDG